MTTDYKNLTPFEAAAVFMIVVGIVLIGAQVFIGLPSEAKANIDSTFEIFDMHEPIAQAYEFDSAVVEFAYNGMAEFNEQFYIAATQSFEPMITNVKRTAVAYNSFFHSMSEGVMSLSDTVAENYKNNYVQSGVEADIGGKVMGAFISR